MHLKAFVDATYLFSFAMESSSLNNEWITSNVLEGFLSPLPRLIDLSPWKISLGHPILCLLFSWLSICWSEEQRPSKWHIDLNTAQLLSHELSNAGDKKYKSPSHIQHHIIFIIIPKQCRASQFFMYLCHFDQNTAGFQEGYFLFDRHFYAGCCTKPQL